MYSIFSTRKILLTSQKNLMNMRLLQITQKRSQIMQYGATIADGDVTAEEISTMRGDNYLRSLQYRGSSYEQASIDANNGLSTTLPLASQEQSYQNMTADEQMAYQQTLYGNNFDSSLQDQAQAEQKKLDAEDYQLELEQKRIETQLQAITTELQTVEQAETKEIQASTPKYSGISGN